MGRKSKQAGGNMPLTHYERTKKFSSSEYGTTSKRLAGHSQYQIGYCALSITRIDDVNENAMCTPSGYIYSEQAIIEYLLTKTQDLKRQQIEYEQQVSLLKEAEKNKNKNDTKDAAIKFEEAQKVIKKRKLTTENNEKELAINDLKRTSYWLADSQPDSNNKKTNINPSSTTSITTTTTTTSTLLSLLPSPPPERPTSPFTEQPIRRKDIWPIKLVWDDSTKTKVICAISHKTIQTQQAIAYWTDSNKDVPGTVVLESIFNELIIQQQQKPQQKLIKKQDSNNELINNNDNTNTDKKLSKMICPLTGKKIKYTRLLQKSGSSFASSGQAITVQQYRPTIT